MKQNISIFTPMANEEKQQKFIIKILSFKKYFNKFRYFIIIDKASTDHTYQIVKELEKNQSLTVIWSPKNKTVVDAYMEDIKTV